MTSMLAMGRRGRRCGWGTKCISPKPASDLAPQLITHVETTPAPLSDEGFSPQFMPIWLRRTSSQINISSMRDMLRVPISSRRNLTMGWTWLAPPSKRTGIKRRPATTSHTSPSIGKRRRSPAHKDGSVRAGHPSDSGKSLIKVKFSQSDCKVCPSRTSSTGTTRRSLTLHPRAQMQALFAARQQESTDAFKETYRHRAGIEGTHSQAVRTMGLRRSRYIGLRKTHLGHVAVAAAVTIIQLISWLRGEAPEQTRTSPSKK